MEQSTPTERVTRILGCLAADPTRRLTLSEIAGTVDASMATCSRIVSTLVAQGYVTRDEAKAYALGPAILGLGRAAARGLPVVGAVRPWAVRASQGTGFGCAVTAVEGEDIVVLDEAPESTGEVGRRIVFTPPVGVTHSVWRANAEIDRWLDRRPGTLDHRGLVRLGEVVSDARSQGYLVDRLAEDLMHPLAEVLRPGEGPEVLARMVEELSPEVRQAIERLVYPMADRKYLAAEVRPGESYPVSIVSAPVYGPGGAPAAILMVMVRTVLSYDRLVDVCGHLGVAARGATEDLDGYDPWQLPGWEPWTPAHAKGPRPGPAVRS